jgi:hypothetical protein
MQVAFSLVAIAITLVWIVVGIVLTGGESALVTAAVVLGGALVLRGVFTVMARVWPQLRGEGNGSRSGEGG